MRLRPTAIFLCTFFCSLSVLNITSCTTFYRAPDVLAPESVQDEALSRVLDSIVRVDTRTGYGSGVIVKIDRSSSLDEIYVYVLTALHVVDDQPTASIVYRNEITTYEALVIWSDSSLDQALLVYTVTDIDSYIPSAIALLPTEPIVGAHIFSVGYGFSGRCHAGDGRAMDAPFYRPTRRMICGPVIYGDSGGGIIYFIKGVPHLAGTIVSLAVYDGREVWTLGFYTPIQLTVETWIEEGIAIP